MMNLHNASSSPLSQKYSQRKMIPTDSEADPFSLFIVDDFLQGVNDWRNVPDIVRMTLKSLSDVVRNQGETIRELERQNISNVKLVNLQEYLDQKVSSQEVSESLREIVNILENKPNYQELSDRLLDFPLKVDVEYMLRDKADIADIKELLSNKANVKQVSDEIDNIHGKIDDTLLEMREIRQDQDQQNAKAQNEIKRKIEEINKQIEQKANKQTVASALQRKVNKADIDIVLARKAESQDLQNLIISLEGKADKNLIESLEDLLESKAERRELNSLNQILNLKAEKADIEILQGQLQRANLETETFKELYERDFTDQRKMIEDLRFFTNQSLTKKGDAKDIDKIYQILSQKIEIDSFSNSVEEIRREVQRDINSVKEILSGLKKSTEESAQQRHRKAEELINNNREDLLQLHNHLKKESEERKNSSEDQNNFLKNLITGVKKELSRDTSDISTDLEKFKRDCASSLSQVLSKQEFLEFQTKISGEIEEKTDLNEVQTALNACQSDVSQRFLELKEEVKGSVSKLEEDVDSKLDKKANFQDVHTALSQKADNQNMQILLSNKVSHSEVEEIRKVAEKSQKENEDKISLRDFEQFQSSTISQIEELQREVLLKCNVKDVCILLDTKSNIDDTNRTLQEIYKELQLKSYQEDLSSVVNDQAIINQQLCTENLVARWAWKSGEIKTGSLVPWEVQLVNTHPDNFLWEKDMTSILIVSPGIYELSLGFFSKKKPTIQVLVNGKAIISIQNADSLVSHSTFGKVKETKNSTGAITGLTVVEFLLLPARSRINVTYSGEYGGEGFLCLKRL